MGPPIPVQPTLAGAKGMDAYAGRPAETRPRYRGVRPTHVQAWLNNRSLFEADCQITSEAYALRFKSFNVLDLPDYRRASPPAVVTCRKGNLRGQARLEVVNISAERRQRRAKRSAAKAPEDRTADDRSLLDDRPGDIWVYPRSLDVHMR